MHAYPRSLGMLQRSITGNSRQGDRPGQRWSFRRRSIYPLTPKECLDGKRRELCPRKRSDWKLPPSLQSHRIRQHLHDSSNACKEYRSPHYCGHEKQSHTPWQRHSDSTAATDEHRQFVAIHLDHKCRRAVCQRWFVAFVGTR